MIERRWTSKVEIRASGDVGSMVISGYAARWGILSQNLGNSRNGNFRETLRAGCFQRSLQSDRNVACLFNHDPSAILGTKRAGTLAVIEDARGLKFRCNVAPTSTGKDVYSLIKRGEIADCSFAFEIDGNDGDSWSEIDDPDNPGEHMGLRTVSRAKLFDVSAVLSPAYDGTDVGTEDDNEDDDIFLNSRRSMKEYFPQGVPQSFPMEVRARIMTAQYNSGKEVRKARLLNFIIS
jgi:uncharacterized protein